MVLYRTIEYKKKIGMHASKKTYERDIVQVQLRSFHGKGGVFEYHALLSITSSEYSFSEQLKMIQKAYDDMICNELAVDTVPVFRRFFLSDVVNQTDEVLQQERENSFCSLSIVQQPPMNGTKIALWVYLLSEAEVHSHNPYLFEVGHNGYRHLWTGGLFNGAANSEYQTRLLFSDYVIQLTEQQCTLADNCIRTWLFVQNVDVNYAGVVKARREIFLTQKLTENTHYITSTGIEGRHVRPEVQVQMDAYSIAGIRQEQIQFLYAPTHLNPTYEYGVTFERGVAVTYGDRKQIYISGTASIDNKGEIVYPGDVIKQTVRMMKNIMVLLEEAEATLEDVVQAIVYLRDWADYQRVNNHMQSHYPNFPYIAVFAPVCRPGWLIETECIAITDKGNISFRDL